MSPDQLMAFLRAALLLVEGALWETHGLHELAFTQSSLDRNFMRVRKGLANLDRVFVSAPVAALILGVALVLAFARHLLTILWR